MNTKPAHLDFAAFPHESQICVWCGTTPERIHDQFRVTHDVVHPLDGYVTLCDSCAWRDFATPTTRNRKIENRWRTTAPLLIPIVPDAPIYLVVRKKCDDIMLADAIKEVFARLPRKIRNKIVSYTMADPLWFLRGLRFECLGRWAGISDAAGMNMENGHVIRLRASFVKTATPDALLTTIAHELGHTEQCAEDLTFRTQNECELDVERRIAEWGFGNEDGTAKESAVDHLDAIVRRAREVKKAIQNCHCPSGNYAVATSRCLQKAYGALWNAERRWSGSDQ